MKAFAALKTTILISALFCCTSLFAQDASNAPNALSDPEVISNIQTKIAADPAVAKVDINITSHNGMVKLNGEVANDEIAEALVATVFSAKGVKDIDSSSFTVKTSDHPINDVVTIAKVKGTFLREKLFAIKSIADLPVNVEANRGIVYLSGSVETQEQADQAEKLASSVPGVIRTESKILVSGVNPST